MIGPGGRGARGARDFEFEVSPRILAEYADALQAAASGLGAVGEALSRIRVERSWFGELPQSGFLFDRYGVHRENELAVVEQLSAWAAQAGVGLCGTAGRYSAADQMVADLAGTVATGLGVGIESGADSVPDLADGARE
ncbi:hypothetical protein ACFQ9X_47145 [Catenulispora yoronensis]